MKKNYKKSDLNITSEKNYRMISFEKSYFVPIKDHMMNQENMYIEYVVEGTRLDEIKLLSYEKLEIIYQLLGIVEKENKVCDYELSPTNIYVDFLGNVKILERKVLVNNNEFIERKITEIKALLGFLYLKKDYEKLLKTNNKAILNNKKVVNFMKMQTIEDLKKILETTIMEEKKKFNTEKKVVNEKKYKGLMKNKGIYRASIIIVVVLLLITTFYILPFKKDEIQGYTSYISEDYTSALMAYEDDSLKRMTTEDKYVYAISTIKTQSQLNKEQKNKILSSISMKTNENILDYWVYIGQGNYEEANNKAIVVNDVDMQIYALLLLVDQTQNNPDLNAEDRRSQISSYEGQIDSLKEAKEELNTKEETN